MAPCVVASHTVGNAPGKVHTRQDAILLHHTAGRAGPLRNWYLTMFSSACVSLAHPLIKTVETPPQKPTQEIPDLTLTTYGKPEGPIPSSDPTAKKV